MKAASLATRLHRPETKRFIAFLMTGGLAALVNISSRFGFQAALSAVGAGPLTAYEIAVALAYLVGMTTAFLLARTFVFAGSGRKLHVQYGRFALVNLAALTQVWLVSVLLARAALPALGLHTHAETVAHVIGVMSPVLVSYYGHKRFSFA